MAIFLARDRGLLPRVFDMFMTLRVTFRWCGTTTFPKKVTQVNIWFLRPRRFDVPVNGCMRRLSSGESFDCSIPGNRQPKSQMRSPRPSHWARAPSEGVPDGCTTARDDGWEKNHHERSNRGKDHEQQRRYGDVAARKVNGRARKHGITP